MNTSATVTARPRLPLLRRFRSGVQADGGQSVGPALPLPLIGQDGKFGFPGGECFFDDAAIDSGEPSPQLVDRFVQVGLDHQIPIGIEHIRLIGGAVGGGDGLTVRRAGPTNTSRPPRVNRSGSIPAVRSLVKAAARSNPHLPSAMAAIDFGIWVVGELGEPGSGLGGHIQLGGGPIAHRPGPVGGVDLEPVQMADQVDLAGSDPGDLRFPGDQFFLPGVDLLIDQSGLTPTFHTRQYEPGV